MIRLFIRFRTSDFDAFQAAYAENVEFRRNWGVLSDSVHYGTLDRNAVVVLHDFESEEIAETFLADLKAADFLPEFIEPSSFESWLSRELDWAPPEEDGAKDPDQASSMSPSSSPPSAA